MKIRMYVIWLRHARPPITYGHAAAAATARYLPNDVRDVDLTMALARQK